MKSFFFVAILDSTATKDRLGASKSSKTRGFCSAGLNRSDRVDPVKDCHSGNDACSLPNALKNWGGFARH
jgi:hypothetical protein